MGEQSVLPAKCWSLRQSPAHLSSTDAHEATVYVFSDILIIEVVCEVRISTLKLVKRNAAQCLQQEIFFVCFMFDCLSLLVLLILFILPDVNWSHLVSVSYQNSCFLVIDYPFSGSEVSVAPCQITAVATC